MDEATLYYRDNSGALVTQRAGDALPQSALGRARTHAVFRLSAEAGRDHLTCCAFSTNGCRFPVAFFLVTQAQASEQEQGCAVSARGLFRSGRAGGVCGLANALVYRDRGFGAYSVYVLTMVLGQAGLTGVGGMLFWPEIPALNNPTTFFCRCWRGTRGLVRASSPNPATYRSCSIGWRLR